MLALPIVAHLSNDELVARVRALAVSSCQLTAQLLVHMAEVEAREIHLQAACGSMFVYVTRVLGFDEAAAYRRINAARLGRRFPRVFELLAEGRLHLAAIGLLGPHLTDDNHREILEEAAGKSKRDLEVMLAARAPKPDVPAAVRKLPAPRLAAAMMGSTAQTGLALSGQSDDPRAASAQETPTRTAAAAAAPPVTAPLSADRFQVKFTASAALVDKLEQTRALLAHRESGCDIARVLEVAVDHLHAALLKERFGVGARPRAPRTVGSESRHVPKAVRRQVVERDGLACAYVDPRALRPGPSCGGCGSRDRLELQHHQPFALAGTHDAQNLSVYCRAHNAFAARRDYGPAHIEARIRARSDARSRN